jgi:hypothetical protein
MGRGSVRNRPTCRDAQVVAHNLHLYRSQYEIKLKLHLLNVILARRANLCS